jgi:HprK-related kinase A
MLAGWRLLSDEHCLLDLATLDIVPFVRPISLKNNSIKVIQQSHANAKASRVFNDTLKGKMLYLAPTALSWEKSAVVARGKYVIFPKFQQGAELTVQPITEAELFERILANSFNYTVLGEKGFNAVVDWLPELTAYDFVYSDNQAMLHWVENLT